MYWGFEGEWMGNKECYLEGGELENFLGVIYMGLIYVNLEGFNVNFDLVLVVKDICEIFGRMVMNDYEMVVLIVGGYIFGKIYGVVNFDKYVVVELVGVGIEE